MQVARVCGLDRGPSSWIRFRLRSTTVVSPSRRLRTVPRFGETTYRLTNINRSEPSPQLFEIPADFTVVDPAMQRDVIFERKIVK